jgi:hypothetical protein
MKKNLVIGLVCILTVGLSANVQAQENKKKPSKEKAHAHEADDHAHDEKADHKHDDHDKDHKHEEKGHSHDQAPPHGGTTVKLGKHAFNLEFVRDPDASKFQVFVLDGHMEYAAVPEKSFDLLAKVQGKEHHLTLERVAAPGASKVAERSSVFEGSADWIKSTKKFAGTIPEITLNGKTFTNVSFAFPKASRKTL